MQQNEDTKKDAQDSDGEPEDGIFTTPKKKFKLNTLNFLKKKRKLFSDDEG